MSKFYAQAFYRLALEDYREKLMKKARRLIHVLNWLLHCLSIKNIRKCRRNFLSLNQTSVK